MLTLRAFGGLDIRDERGKSLAALLAQPKRAALFAYLALGAPGELQRRDSLLAVFWPESDQARGRSALSQALSFIRRELGEDALVTRGAEEVGVDAGLVQTDVRAFEEAMASGEWALALKRYGGDFLKGLHVQGSGSFVDWVDRERERLKKRAAGAAWRCAHDHIASGRLVEAERVAQRALTFVPTEESPVRDFVESLANAGDRGAALRFYEKFAAVLAAELEVEPAPETVAVVESIRARNNPIEVAPGASVRTGKTLPPARTSPRPWRRWRSVALPGALLLAAFSLLYRPGGEPETLIGQADHPGVVVADLESPSNPGLGMTAAQWLREQLDQSDIVRPVDPAAVGAARRRMMVDSSPKVDYRTAFEVAARDGYPLVLAGTIAPAGGGFVIGTRLEAVPSGRVLARFHQVAPSVEKLGEAMDRMGADIRTRIDESRDQMW